ncbi:MAG: alanine--tRNA ligase [Firmicutes bacterium]|nr:alanine--tRNA ligase [Bacillota bacterium]
MTYKQLKELWFKFYRERGHAIIPSASVVPDGDASVLFINSGMHPLVPYLMGEAHPLGVRLANVQKCIRTGDIDDVGDATHTTFFEMMGNWSMGDYFKEDKIKWSWEFVTGKDWLNISPKKIAVTVFKGDEIAPRDEESVKLWLSVGVPKERIYFLGKADNWWQLPNGTGPCGPCTEMHFITDKKPCGEKCDPACDCGRFVEIANDVFMEYIIDSPGAKPRKAKQQNVDTGYGLERILYLINGYEHVYQSELFNGALKIIGSTCKSGRVIAEHTRASIVLIADGVTPNNTGQGYILRRLIRRAVRYAHQLNFKDYPALINNFSGILGEFYPEIQASEKITKVFMDEVSKFEKTLERGLKEFNKLKTLDGKTAFKLYETYGFPLEFTQELAAEKGMTFSIDEYNAEKDKHTKMSQTASAGAFKGGLADTSGETTKLHTANHLLLEVLRRNFGKTVMQKGSNITPERLRFDFTLDHKMTEDEIKKVEKETNELIQKNLSVTYKEMSLKDAEKINAIGAFGAKYGDVVKVFFIGEDSIEICGGPHVQNTSELGIFKIQKEESAGAGIRRIKATLS